MPTTATADTFLRLIEIMARLRGPGGCPWDREQTHQSLRPYLLEEAYEVLDAMEGSDPGELRDELGDLLLQIVFHAQLAAEVGDFDIADVARAIGDKLTRRHPHVFGDATARDAAEVATNWARIKREERRSAGADPDPFAGVPAALPALARAERLGERATHVGLDWPDAATVLEKVHEELGELQRACAGPDRDAIAHEVGDLLLAVANLARHLQVPPEIALQDANRRFVERTRHAEGLARERGTTLADLDPHARNRLWDQAKRTPR